MNGKNKHLLNMLQCRHQTYDRPDQHHAIALIDKLVLYPVRTLARLTGRTYCWKVDQVAILEIS